MRNPLQSVVRLLKKGHIDGSDLAPHGEFGLGESPVSCTNFEHPQGKPLISELLYGPAQYLDQAIMQRQVR
jgi:hypothetical protein